MSMLPSGPYAAILADPPWFYRDRCLQRQDGQAAKFGFGAVNHYPVMRVEDICALPVRRCAAADAWLFLWATWPTLPDALRVIAAWGFVYSTCAFCWVKTNVGDGQPFFGIGHATRSNSEICLLGRRGSPVVISNHVSQIVMAPRREHSRKPDEVRDRIVQLCGDVPRIELFARERSAGWDCWGNQLDRFTAEEAAS